MFRLWLCVAGAIVILAACRPAPIPTPLPTATVAPTSRFPTYTGPVVRATLPPTWTPTFTASPAPPTQTPTTTLTPAPSPTLSATEVCAGFQVALPLKDGARYTTGDEVTIVFGTSAPDVTVRFLATLRGTDRNLGVQAPGGQMFGMQLPLARLPGPGIYDWTLVVHSETLGDLCGRGGWFILDAGATAEATAEATETATAETTAGADDRNVVPATLPS